MLAKKQDWSESGTRVYLQEIVPELTQKARALYCSNYEHVIA
jgi:hypothetical protein